MQVLPHMIARLLSVVVIGLRSSVIDSLWGHSVYNNTEHFSRSQVENLSIKGQKSISYHIESSI